MIGAKVDALALMLDGACSAGGGYRPSSVWVKNLVREDKESWLAIRRDNGDLGEVAEAILELEARADWWLRPDDETAQPFPPKGLAYNALAATPHISTLSAWYLEAAARLRDGWRPSGWKAGSR